MKYTTKGTCSREITFDVIDNKVRNVSFYGGCNGNLKGIGALVEGRPAEEVVKLLKGMKCGFKNTSCPDQLALALEKALDDENK